MKRTGIITTVLATAALFGTASVVAGPHHRGFDPDRMLEHMAEALELTDSQRESIQETMQGQRDEMHALHEQMRANHREMRNLDPADPNYQSLSATLAQRQGELTTQMMLLRSQLHAELMGVLSEEQQAKLSELREQHAQRMERRHEHHRDRAMDEAVL